MAEDFEEFWKAYPRKVGKLAALKAWNKLTPSLAEVLAALSWQTKEWDDPKYTPHPSTYLTQGRWMDEQPAHLRPRERRCQYDHTPACDSSSECVQKFLAEQREIRHLRAV